MEKIKMFSFADAYAPLDFGAIRFCEAAYGVPTVNEPDMDKYKAFILENQPRNAFVYEAFKPSACVTYEP
jgi:hypothetical protein